MGILERTLERYAKKREKKPWRIPNADSADSIIIPNLQNAGQLDNLNTGTILKNISRMLKSCFV